jgi:2-keto-4-pentenoate hydratase/2-oxohepta-3-ene-1,7-dioic acid hydratase in catechol pathway
MRLVTFTGSGSGRGAERIGAVVDGGVVDLSTDPELPPTMVELVALGAAGLEAVAALVDGGPRLPTASVQLLAPIRPRNNIMAVGRNYVDHSKEFSASGFDAAGAAMIPDHPIIFTKATSSIIADGETIEVGFDATGTCDYEGELGVVIGAGGTDLDAGQAEAAVYGYTIINDVTIREVQRRHVQFFLGKSGRTHAPMGPWIVTSDGIDDIRSSWVRTSVNGELRQAAPIADLIFDIPTLITTISSSVRLEPGDVIATGTPAGVGIGFDPPRFLAPGDRVEITIDGVGTLSNPVA